jgi:branched-chain amino acid transport system substrate-binding protein
MVITYKYGSSGKTIVQIVPHFLVPAQISRGVAAASHHIADRFSGLRKASAILCLFLALGSCETWAAGAASPNEILLGMSTVLTGSAENLGKDMQRGIVAGLDRANRNGGLNGRVLRLIALDDAYLPARTSSNMRQLIEKDHVLAVIGNVGTPTANVAVPIANEQKTLLFAPFAGGPNLRNEPPDRYVINFRAGYAEKPQQPSTRSSTSLD